MIRVLFLGLALAFVGCASRYDQALQQARATPFEQRPALYAQFLKEGTLSKENYDWWMEGWEEERAEKAEEAKLLASMTPSERAFYKLEKERLEIQKEQLAAQQAQLAQSRRAAEAQAIHNINASAAAQGQANAQFMSNLANPQNFTRAAYGR